ncbi:Multi antimicrobial extrusion protein [Cordyceps fumosorosea ARSEF 2679]|uniref:Multi antimicrobial extrusion protein n=1 Tax=Cordyceps fumosorosea (strain ARSEF 2679) TaxID=1081104 RepID=A0A167UC70_CORFA|nr:Multi antimicrobial extrusion protein [Cordyceps fumosorosea ARSEF 2679]OAA61439.1 Multi antimicrobial extrusion protein [Cordyceps fumosorosea ARSEF 2679]
MSLPRSTGTANRISGGGLSASFRASSPLAEALARDIAECSDDDVEQNAVEEGVVGSYDHTYGSRSNTMYRRPSGVAYGASRPVFDHRSTDEPAMTPLERKQSRHAERSLLRDNHILPPKHQRHSHGFLARLYRRLFSTKIDADGEHPNGPIARRPGQDETAPLLHDHRGDITPTDSDSGDVEQQWIDAVASGRIRTTWQRETQTVITYCIPLITTFVLQYSINVASIFAVGRIGKMELGAVSSYGSGHKHLVGLQCQRMALFLLSLSAPVIVIWCFSEEILVHLVPEAETARLASLYLKVCIASIPGVILFECGKRFTQAQGLFRATTYVLLIAAPFNIFINWLLVWKLEYGFIGAPIAVAITENLLPVLLFLYIRFVDGRQCWGGFSRRALSNWGVMIKLALPGMIMIEAEWLAFEFMTLFASRFGSEYLAAQSVLGTLTTISYQIPFPMSIAASTRVANLIGAGLVDAAKITAKVTFWLAASISIFNFSVFVVFRYHLPLLFTNDEDVIALVAQVIPAVAVMQVFDGLSAGAHGLLRGIGKQAIGGPINLVAYYLVSLPLSIGLAFGAGLKLEGLWIGVTAGLMIVSSIEYVYLWKTDWSKAADEAADRNATG